MKITKKIESEILQVMDNYWGSYLSGDFKTWASYLLDNYGNIGTTKEEVWKSKKEILDYTDRISKQVTGTAEIRNKVTQFIPYDPYIMVHEVGDMFVKAEEGWIFYAQVRLSSLLNKINNEWKIFHQHGSYPDSKADEGEAFGFEKLRIENKKLKDAIQSRTIELERKNRDLEIESAMERIRSKSLSMQNTADLQGVVQVLFNEMQGLSVEMDFGSVSIYIFKEDTKDMEQWLALPDGVKLLRVPYFEHPILSDLFEARKRGEDIFAKVYTVEVKNSWTEKGFEITDYKNLPEEFKASILAAPGYSLTMALEKNSGIAIPNFEGRLLSDEDNRILKRAGMVFEQSYIRFQDLKKAEAQAREAKIEAALESIRSRSLAVTKSDEFNEVVSVVFEKLGELGILIDSVLIALNQEGTKDLNVYGCGSSEEGVAILNFQLPYFPNPFIDDALKAQNNLTTGYYSKVYNEEEKNQYYDYALKNTELKNLPPDIKKRIGKSKSYALSVAYTQSSMIMLNDMSGKILNEDDADIIRRFSRVFEQAYIRFLDLQKAEAQAREAQIEAALERTRAQSMMMQHSEELTKTSEVFHEQLCNLGIEAEFSYLWLPDEKNSEHLFWATWREKKDGKTIFKNKRVVYPLDKTEPSIAECYVAWESGLPVHVNPVKPEGIKEYFDTWYELLKGVEKFKPENYPEGLYYIDAYMKYGCFGIMIKEAISEDDEKVLARFSKEFERTYTRFLDLKKAEAQAREAQIEAALEKVRSRSLAMHQSEELGEVITTVVDQLKSLDFTVDDGVALITHIEGSKDLVEWMENPGFPSAIKFILPYFDHPVLSDLWQAKEKGEKFIATRYSAEQNKSFLNHIYEHTDFKHTPQEIKEYSLAAETYGYTITFQKHTAIFINDYSGYSLSEDEIDILLRFSRVFEQAYIRFLDLQKAEAQAREAQIQLSLERVRARSLAMQSSDELHEVLGVLFRQFDALGIQPVNVFLSLFNREERTLTYRASGKSGKRIPGKQVVEVDSIEALQALYDKWLTDNSDTVEVIFYPKEVLPQLFGIFAETFASMPEEDRMGDDDFPDGGYSMAGYTPFGYLGYDHQRQATQEEKDILSRFCIEFARVYQRFLDIQKAEKQAREAQVETALERVRARSLAMHNSNEMQSVANTVYDQLIELGIEIDAVGMSGVIEARKDYDVWIGGSPFSDPIRIPFNESTQVQKDYNEVIEQRPELFAKTYTGDIKKEYINHLLQHGTFAADLKKKMVESTAFSTSISTAKNSGIQIVRYTNQPYNDQVNEILKRFAKVFEQAYIRFMDLQKSEAQAREAQIEAALERVRAASMAMHKTDELGSVVEVLFQQFSELDLDFYQVWINIFELEEGISNCWFSPVEGVFEEAYTAVVPLGPFEETSIKSWRAGEEFSYLSWSGLEEVDAIAKSLTEMTGHSSFVEIQEKKRMDRMEIVDSNHKYGVMAMAKNNDITDNDRYILKRFTMVFELTYTRFLDLQKAEEQAREAKIEAALEKVRSRTMAMQKSDELPEAANNLFLQVQDLGIPAWSAGYCIWDESKQNATANMSSEGVLQKPFVLPNTGEGYDFNEPFHKGESFHVSELGGEALVKHYEFMRTLPIFGEVIDGIIEAGFPLPTFQIFHIVYFSHGYLMFITYEPVPEAHDIFKRFGQVFEQTYTRFLDLKRAESQANLIKKEKERLEKALTELKATQGQLIHAEKMASLGELTAGIAHEIQNPLNFVNNFSEVSSELIEEAKDEMEAGEYEEVMVIIEDLMQNLQKIHHHGERASSIVNGMLDHSRADSGEKVKADINQLADECLRLSYHGMRAKDRDFQAGFDIHLDTDLPKLKIVSQDISRVLLNLINNAFQASSAEALAKENPHYKPKVSVMTKNLGDHIEIIVSDNGPGIPEKIRDKIFQPFFTTKPTGQGTGLGLSLSYDIVKAHSGELTVTTEIGKGSNFIITLPKSSIE